MLISGSVACDVTNIYIFQPLTVTSIPGALFHPKGFRNKKLNWINKGICENCMLESDKLFICFGIFIGYFSGGESSLVDWIIWRFLALLLELKIWQLGLTSKTKIKTFLKRQLQYSSMCSTVSNTVENLTALYSCNVLNWKSKVRKAVFPDCGIIYTLWSTSPNTRHDMMSTDRTEPVEWPMFPCCHSSLQSFDVTTSGCSWCLRYEREPQPKWISKIRMAKYLGKV